MLFAVPPPWEGRQAHLFKLGYEGGTLSPDAEINIPTGLNRRVSGVLAATDNGETLICHRGTFTAFRGRVLRSVTLEHFQAWLQVIDDDGRAAEVIVVTSTDSPSIANDISEFVFEVKQLKEQLKAEINDDFLGNESASVEADELGTGWQDHEEYEGDKSYTPTSERREYPYLHGPLCNALHRRLSELVGSNPEVEVRKNCHIDLALVDPATGKAKAIFEVKTSGSLSAQLYTAYGQLAYYQHRFGGAATKLYLVLPANTDSEFKAGEFFTQANIHVLFGEAGDFRGIDGASLEDVLSSTLQ
ncbi:hypothetical protein [Pseudomonas aeruginosa]|uniref:hypothetical protein n=1 Tax=Pseudomonas aeruginosa TaxID=287 RepID=UPI001F438F3D|nr:hypothetical protein [Pseudomonas aeruginosa]